MTIENGFDLPISATFDLIKAVYDETDAFVADFAETYPSLAAYHDRLNEIRTRPGSIFLVIRDKKELQGYIFILPRTAGKLRHTADLNMGVRQAARGKGTGSILLTAALRQLRSAAVMEIVYLMVREDNLGALRLYKNKGFEELARLDRDTKIGTQYYNGILMRIFVANIPLYSTSPTADFLCSVGQPRP